jgi:phage terminase small subunit
MAKKCTTLSKNQKHFAEEWLIHGNASLAYRTAYPNAKKSYGVSGHHLLKNPKVSAYIERRQAKMAAELEITPEKTLRAYARRAYFDPKRLLDPETGNLIPLHRLPKNVAAAVTEIHVKQLRTQIDEDGNETRSELVRVKWDNGDSSREALSKFLGLFEKDNDQKKPNIEIYNQVRAEVEREMVEAAFEKAEQQATDRDPDTPDLS